MNTDTRKILSEMLKENTGTHMLDSGSIYGRHWQQNQDRDFESEPEAVLKIDQYGIDVSVNVYHWLAQRLEYSEAMDRAFQVYAGLPENQDMPWLLIAEDFPGWLKKQSGRVVDPNSGEIVLACAFDGDNFETGGPSDFGSNSEPHVVNTYNGESLLTQTLQFVWFSVDQTDYILLQIHGGCDVRGGYTMPRAFETTGEGSMWDAAYANIDCGSPDHNWCTDDAYNWYYQGSTQEPKLTEYERVGIEGLDQYYNEESHRLEFPNPYPDPKVHTAMWSGAPEFVPFGGRHSSTLFFDPATKHGYCPFCGGRLEAFA
jgi:hypothetical protein